jgi:hypothetical protein
VRLIYPFISLQSKNNFNQKLTRKNSIVNLSHLAHLKANGFPCIKTLDDSYLMIDPKELESILPQLFDQLLKNKLFTHHKKQLLPYGEFTVAIDTHVTHTYHEKSQHLCHACSYCLKRQRSKLFGMSIAN